MMDKAKSAATDIKDTSVDRARSTGSRVRQSSVEKASQVKDTTGRFVQDSRKNLVESTEALLEEMKGLVPILL
jgi:hypothetical protein